MLNKFPKVHLDKNLKTLAAAINKENYTDIIKILEKLKMATD